jgi:hypothetical protein
VKVNRTGPDGTPTWKRHAGIPVSSQERAKNQDRSSHGPHEIVRRFPVLEIFGGDPRRGTLQVNRCAQIPEQAAHRPDVYDRREILQANISAFGQQGSCQRREGRILCTTHDHLASERHTAFHDELVQQNLL